MIILLKLIKCIYAVVKIMSPRDDQYWMEEWRDANEKALSHFF